MQFRKVCNHPDLFERADINSPFAFTKFGKTSSILRSSDNDTDVFYSSKNPIEFHLPRLIYDDLILPNFENSVDTMAKLLNYTLSIFNPTTNFELCQYLTRLTGSSTHSMSKLFHQDIINRAIELSAEPQPLLEKLAIVFAEKNKIKDNFHRDLILMDKADILINTSKVTTKGILDSLLNIKETVYENEYLNSLHPGYRPNASAVPISLEISGCSHLTNEMNYELFNPVITQALSEIPPITQYNMHINKKIPIEEFPKTELFPAPLNKNFSSNISMPSMDRFITESAKLKKLDELLVQLKREGHRVLIYFQMTKMMDLMEEYLTYRQYNHIRLDGSSKLEDRRDLVHDWQTKPEIFVFLLSTRAGGLGINLTAADTVIFYDSDWNPTIDSQAMDRAHRLGQTRQVTVYRLLIRGTIEERMRDRAKQKEQVQQVVMEGKTQENNVKTIEASNSTTDITKHTGITA